MNDVYTVLLVAQPNAGKSTLFNVLTGSRSYVANWPGKTVEVSEGIIEHHGKKLKIIDLPGIQSFQTLSSEEHLTKEVLFKGSWNAVVVLVNAESYHKSLYFALQVLEITKNVVVAISKFDVAERKGMHINISALQEILGVPVVTISALKNIGVGPLLDRIMDTVEGRTKSQELKLNYGNIEKYIHEIEKITGSHGFAVRALEGDNDILQGISQENIKKIEKIKEDIEKEFGFPPNEIIAMERYKIVEDIIKKTTVEVKIAGKSFEDKIDSILLKNVGIGALISILTLLLIMFFAFTINSGFPLNLIFRSFGFNNLANEIETYSLGGLLSSGFTMLSDFLSSIFSSFHYPQWVNSLTVNGIIAGVGAVLSFLPLVFTVNIIMAALEDSGIMARIAVIFNRTFQRFGISGKSAFPMTIGFACNVPAVLSTRILENDKERIAVSLALPFIICQARLIVLLFLITALFVSVLMQTFVTVFIYLLSIILFLVVSRIFSKNVLKSESQELLLELPPYHVPSLKVIGWTAWERSKSFITKAGAVIFPFSIVIWILMHVGFNGYVSDPINSFGFYVGNIISMLFAPMGLDKWQIGLSLLTGFFAKEVFIETLAIAFGTSYPVIALGALHLSIAQSMALIVFVMLYTPCIATFSAMFSETKSLKLTFFSLVFELFVAYALAFIFFITLSFI